MSRSPFSLISLWPLLLAALLLWVGLSPADTDYDWQWQRALRYIFTVEEGIFTPGPLLQGLWLTLRLVAAGLVLSILLGLGAALLRHGPSPLGRLLAAMYVGLVRNTPLLIQLFVMYFVLASALHLTPFWAAVWALAFFEGAYMAEIFRAGLLAVPQNQWEAARSLGFPSGLAFVYIIFPQALRRILPPLTGQAVSLIKDSSLVSAIALPDLTMRAQGVIADTFLSLELWSMVALMYLFLTLVVTIPTKYLEKRYSWAWL